MTVVSDPRAVLQVALGKMVLFEIAGRTGGQASSNTAAETAE